MLHRPIETAPFLRWDEKAGLRRDAICSQRLTRSTAKAKKYPELKINPRMLANVFHVLD